MNLKFAQTGFFYISKCLYKRLISFKPVKYSSFIYTVLSAMLCTYDRHTDRFTHRDLITPIPEFLPEIGDNSVKSVS